MLLTLASCLNLLVLSPDALFNAVKHDFLLFNLGLIVHLPRVVRLTRKLLLVGERLKTFIVALGDFSEFSVKHHVIFLSLSIDNLHETMMPFNPLIVFLYLFRQL